MRKAPMPWVLLPGTLFWIFFVLALTTKNTALVVITVVLGVGTFVGFSSFAFARWRTEKNLKRRVWTEGTPARARVVTAKADGSLNDHPYVTMKLAVIGGRTVQIRQVISQLMVSRVQPGEEIDVKVDRSDPTLVVVDAALTPYGY